MAIANVFWGCQKEDLGNLDGIFSDTTQAGQVSQMTARINNVPWSATSYDITLNPKSSQTVITGKSDNGQTVTLVIANTKPGDYLMTKTTTIGTYSPDSLGTISYKSNQSSLTGGIMNIDSIDTAAQVMSGGFNFIGGSASGATLNITDGKFINLGYTNATKNIQFSAIVNAKTWIPISVTGKVSSPSNVLTITALNANGQKMTLSFPALIKARALTYRLTADSAYEASYTDGSTTLVPAPSNPYNLKLKTKLTCALRIISNSQTSTPHNVQGTFNFYAAPSTNLKAAGVTITSGVFNVNY